MKCRGSTTKVNYLDHAGATLYSGNQIEKSMDDILSSLYMNPHSNTVHGNATKEAIDNIRILDHFHTNEDEYSIIFTSGATAALKLVSETFQLSSEQVKSSSQYGNFVYLQDNHTFEDGTVSFLTILSLQHGFKVLSDIGINNISAHVFSLVRYLHYSLLTLHHQNGMPVIKLYSDTNYQDKNLQGGIISFNVLRDNGEFVGYMEVLNMASLYKIHLRTGCFCNPGACQRHLELLDEEILNNYDAEYTCGGTKDLINDKPTAVKISFGYMSKIEDMKIFLLMLENCFVTGNQGEMEPLWWNNFKTIVQKKFEILPENIIKNVSNNFVLGNNVLCKTNSALHETITFLDDNNMYNINRSAHSKLSKIFIYPVKSCGAYEIENSWKLCLKGLQYDREWMIVTSIGLCLTQKQETKLCMIRPFIDLNNNELMLSFPGMSSIRIPLSISSYKVSNIKICRGKIRGHPVEGIDYGTEISNWLNLALGKSNLKLVRQNESITIKQSNKSELSFASQSQYLLINMASIQWLADKISDDSECRKNSLLHRFRGNFFIEGCEPFEEINWKVVQSGNCKFEVEAVCTRCQMVCNNQTSREKTVEPLRTIAEHQFHGKLKFGIYLAKKFDENSIIKIGDQVQYK